MGSCSWSSLNAWELCGAQIYTPRPPVGPIGEFTALPRPLFSPLSPKIPPWLALSNYPITALRLSILQSWTSALPLHFSPSFLKTDRLLWAPRTVFSRATAKSEVPFHCGSMFIKAVVTSAIRLPCDCNSTARYDHSTTCVTTVGLPVVGCCTLRLT